MRRAASRVSSRTSRCLSFRNRHGCFFLSTAKGGLIALESAPRDQEPQCRNYSYRRHAPDGRSAESSTRPALGFWNANHATAGAARVLSLASTRIQSEILHRKGAWPTFRRASPPCFPLSSGRFSKTRAGLGSRCLVARSRALSSVINGGLGTSRFRLIETAAQFFIALRTPRIPASVHSAGRSHNLKPSPSRSTPELSSLA